MTAVAPAQQVLPRVADGVQLLGEYAGSGFKEPPSLARRGDGQVIQLPPLLYEVLRRTDGATPSDAIAEQVSHAIGRGVDGDDIEFLFAEKLQPLGLISGADGRRAAPVAAPFLGLKFRVAVIPERVTWLLARAFAPLFLPAVVVAAVAGLGAVDWWLFSVHGVAQPVRQTLIHPQMILLMIGLVIASAAYHEVGHAAGCAYGGARPGKMGCGLYLAWPAFYTDITDSYRLDRRGRLRADLGGVYFNCLFALALTGGYFVTHLEPLLLAIIAVHFEIAHQLIPVIRLDGYYIVSDLTGVPDLFARIGPILRSMVRGRGLDERVTALKPWVRWAVTGWVVLLLPVLGAELLLVLMNLPRIYGTGAHQAHHLLTAAAAAAGQGRQLAAATAAAELLILVIPLVGIALMLVRGARGVLRYARRTTADRPALRAATVGVGLAIVGVLAHSWIPPSNYRPIGPRDQGTLGGAVHGVVRQVTSPSWVPQQPVTPSPTSPAGPSSSPTSQTNPTPSARTSSSPQTAASTTPAGASTTPPSAVATTPTTTTSTASSTPTSPSPTDASTPSSPSAAPSQTP